jgi:hypothetical protein
VLKTAALDEPRFEFDRVTGKALGLRVESSATNVLLHSAALTNPVWAGQADFTITPVASVIEGQTAWRFENLGTVEFRTISQIVGTLTGKPESTSILCESDTGEDFVIGLRDLTSPTWVYAITVNAATGAVAVLSGIGRHIVTDLGIGPNGGKLWRVELTATGTAGNTRGVRVYPTGTTLNTDAAIIHHVQHEEALNASSPIVTGASSVTRAADFAGFSGDIQALGIGDAFTAVVVAQEPRATESDGMASALAIGPLAERIVVGARDFINDGNHVAYFQNSQGATVRASGVALPSITAPTRFALAGDTQSTSGAVNGAIVWTTTGAARINPASPINIGRFVDMSRWWGGTIERVVIYPRRLTDAQLQEITA